MAAQQRLGAWMLAIKDRIKMYRMVDGLVYLYRTMKFKHVSHDSPSQVGQRGVGGVWNS